MKEFGVKIVSISPLLMNRFAEEKAEDVINRVSGVKVPEEIAVALYILSDGTIYQPASHIEASIIKAAANFNMAGKGKKKDLTNSGIFVEPDEIPHLIQKYEIDRRPVVNPVTKNRIIRARPILKEWALEFKLQVLDDQFPPEIIKSVLDYAGTAVGIGDHRPRLLAWVP